MLTFTNVKYLCLTFEDATKRLLGLTTVAAFELSRVMTRFTSGGFDEETSVTLTTTTAIHKATHTTRTIMFLFFSFF